MIERSLLRTLLIGVTTACCVASGLSSVDAKTRSHANSNVAPALIAVGSQRPRAVQMFASEWSTPAKQEGLCVKLSGDGVVRPDHALPLQRAGQDVLLQFRLVDQPKRVGVRIWRHVAGGLPSGSPSRSTVEVAPMGRGWSFELPVPKSSKTFAIMRAVWPRRRGCSPRKASYSVRTTVR